jgi:hypothetical protein
MALILGCANPAGATEGVDLKDLKSYSGTGTDRISCAEVLLNQLLKNSSLTKYFPDANSVVIRNDDNAGCNAKKDGTYQHHIDFKFRENGVAGIEASGEMVLEFHWNDPTKKMTCSVKQPDGKSNAGFSLSSPGSVTSVNHR